jgi:hypothetical protein
MINALASVLPVDGAQCDTEGTKRVCRGWLVMTVLVQPVLNSGFLRITLSIPITLLLHFLLKMIFCLSSMKILRHNEFIGMFAKLQKVTVSLVMSTHLSAWNNLFPSGRILMTFDIYTFFNIMLRKFKFH